MGRVAGAAGAGRHLTRWAFALDAVGQGLSDRVALVLAPSAVASLPPDLRRAEDRGSRRRRVLAALCARIGVGTGDLAVGADGVRRLAGTPLYASVAERSGWAAAVVSRTPVGIDLEAVDEAEASTAAVLAEIEAVDPTAWHGLAGIWAAREATLKAMGRDLTCDPGGWRFGGGSVTAAGGARHKVDLVALRGIVAAVAYVGD